MVAVFIIAFIVVVVTIALNAIAITPNQLIFVLFGPCLIFATPSEYF